MTADAAAPPVARATGRLASLDGLRGVAAVVVLAHHALLLLPWASDVYLGGPAATGVGALLSYTPLHLAWAGTEAVFLFFVLSGLVLAFPTLRGAVDWGRYFPSRILRLYLPVAAAVAFAAVLWLVVPRGDGIGSAWVQAHPREYPLSGMLADVTLLGGTSRAVSPLWSLTWEVFFSLLLPVYVAVAHRVAPWLAIVGSLVLVTVGAASGNDILYYLPMFAIGVALAHAWNGIGTWAARVNAHRLGPLLWLAVAALAVLLSTVRWTLAPVLALDRLATPVIVVGVTGFVLLAGFSPLARRLLSLRPVVWLGAVSFSLYLTHEPILVALANVFPTQPRLALVVGVVVALPVAWLFHRAVERPTHRLAQRVAGKRPAVR